MNQTPISRRAALRGVGKGLGIAIGLPFLDAMLPRRFSGAMTAAAADEAPLASAPALNRMLLLYIPNGVHLANWYPKATGADYQMSPALEPLAKFQKDFLLLGGLNVDTANAYGRVGDHAQAMACFGTGVSIKKTPNDDIKCGISFDQVIAHAVGEKTRFPSLELGLDYGRMEGGCDPGFACIYSNNISWHNATTPAIKEVNPKNLFDRLFARAKAVDHLGESRDQQEMYNRSILDFTRDSLTRLNGQLGSSDRHRVDEYLTSIREIERRLDAPPSDVSVPDGVTRPVRVPDTFKEHFRLMADLQILAIQQDITRVSTFTLGVEQSRRVYPEIGIPEEHHGLTHHAGNAEKIAKVCKIDNYMCQQFAYFLERMKSIKEGEGTLLDNSMVVLGNGNGDGARHDHTSCAMILAGKGGGTLSPGRYVRYPRGTPATNLWLSLMDRMGVQVERHGDSTGRVDQLQV